VAVCCKYQGMIDLPGYGLFRVRPEHDVRAELEFNPQRGADTVTDEDPNKVFSVQAVPKSLQERAIDMAFSQGFGTILACVVIYFLWTGMQQQIPIHIKAITDGYKQISDEDRAARTSDVARFAETHKTLVDTFKAEQERTERILTGRVSKLEEGVKRIESAPH
jgi:hypothetical protein